MLSSLFSWSFLEQLEGEQPHWLDAPGTRDSSNTPPVTCGPRGQGRPAERRRLGKMGNERSRFKPQEPPNQSEYSEDKAMNAAHCKHLDTIAPQLIFRTASVRPSGPPRACFAFAHMNCHALGMAGGRARERERERRSLARYWLGSYFRQHYSSQASRSDRFPDAI